MASSWKLQRGGGGYCLWASLGLWLSLLLSFSDVGLVKAKAELLNVTGSVFGPDLTLLPVAFGDFNGDRITDLFVLTADRSKVIVLLAKEDTFSPVDQYFVRDPSKRIECSVNNADIVSVVPGDFDGDGGMDVLVVMARIAGDDDDDEGEDEANNDDHLTSFVLWGDHDIKTGKHRLVCQESHHDWTHHLRMTVQPMALDANGDYVADLFGARPTSVSGQEEERGMWVFKAEARNQTPEFVPLLQPPVVNESVVIPVLPPISKPFHSNAYLDLNGDGSADIFVTAQNRFEVWINDPKLAGNSNSSNYRLAANLTIDGCHEHQSDCILGQVAFTDLDLDGKMDAVVAVCFDGHVCANASLLASPVRNFLSGGGGGTHQPFEPLNLILRDWKFGVQPEKEAAAAAVGHHPYSALTLRVGDINLDGYPDFLVRLTQPLVPHQEFQTHLLLNVEWQDDDQDPAPPKGTRGFILQESVMRDVKDSQMATFFDWREDGIPDIITVQATSIDIAEGRTQSFRVGAFTNATRESDAYFVKVIVLSGVCNGYGSCPGHKIEVPYGTNMPGQMVCYKTKRSGPTVADGFATVSSCAAQLAQSAHTAMSLPYSTFGLGGQSPNYIETMYVNVSNASDYSRSQTWQQIIPNSQMYVIPHPPLDPEAWKLKLFITPSRNILFTAIGLMATCLVVVLIILIFHWRDKVQDRKEKLQEANRFHFDAM